MAAPAFLSEEEKKEVAAAIKKAEEQTFGEIRVYLEKKCKGDSYSRALKIFHTLHMNETRLHSGVLIYLAYDDHVFAIVGDQGIHEKVPSTFWDDVKETMRLHFASGNFKHGITEAVVLCGNHLKKHFPTGDNNPNELSNEVITGDE